MGPMSDLDRFTEAELQQMDLDAYCRALTHFENAARLTALMAGMDPRDPGYQATAGTVRTCMEVGAEAHELHRAVVARLDAIRSARKASAGA